MATTTSAEQNVEPFPSLPDCTSQDETKREDEAVSRAEPVAPRRTRGASLLQSFIESSPPLGMWQATGEVGSKIPTLPEIRNGEFSSEGWSQEGQMERRGTNPHEIHRITRARRSSASTRTKSTILQRSAPSDLPDRVDEEVVHDEKNTEQQSVSGPKTQEVEAVELHQTNSGLQGPDATGTYPNGYRFPKKHSWSESTVIGLRAFWKFFLTPMGFLITIYGLNVIGWGAMIFFVLLKAVSPGMCVPTCNDTNSPRQKWIEIDSQVLNALFCVTGFGLIPWRFRDFYYLIRWRLGGNHIYHRKLAGIYRGWYRLPGSQSLPDYISPPPKPDQKSHKGVESPPPYSTAELLELKENGSLPLPASSIPDPPLTGFRAPTTRSWTLDIVIWMYLWNTLIQGALAGIMWGLNRHTRPSWATGFLISLGSITGIIAGVVVFIEGSRVKKIEGIPVQEYDVLESIEDYQARKTKEDAKQAKKAAKKNGEHHTIIHTKKVKGHSWYTRS